MNKDRRTRLREQINTLRKVVDEISSINDEESMVFDNIPENLQGSDRGMDMEDAMDIMTENIETLENVISELEELV